MATFQYFSKNGEVLPIDQATVSLFSIEYSYGFGVYETIRVQHGIAHFASEHVARLLNSARILELEHHFTVSDILSVLDSLIRALDADEAYNLKILFVGGKEARDATFSIIPSAPLFPDRKLYRDGVSTITAEYERLFPKAKTLNMLGSYLAYRKAKKAGCYDALLINRHGAITEGTRSNFFVIHGKTVISPPSEQILDGVTRTVMLKVAAEQGYTYEERDIRLEDISTYGCAFLTSTSAGIMPIRRIDSFEFASIPESLKELIAHYDTWKKDSGGVLKK